MTLPIEAVLEPLVAALAAPGNVVVVGPPGSGKTTRVPPALAAAFGRVVVAEPRRVAARAVAAHLAAQRVEPVGRSIGLTTRDDRRVSAATVVEFVTEGVLTRRLQQDPGLDGIDVVVFDEFHERSLAADLGLALCLDVQRSLRPDLRIVAMSATLDADAVAGLLDAPVVVAEGRRFPVTTTYLPPVGGEREERAVAAAVQRALADGPGDVLVFLPGVAEIRRAASALEVVAGPVDVLPLHGQLPAADQDRALAPASAGRRKVVLATNVAETSLTIDGVTAVVDTGRTRRVHPDAAVGLTRLVTVRVSAAEADQRRGRAGRQGPGRCYRLWAEPDTARLEPHAPPEISVTDLTGLALELAVWGVTDPADLTWSDPPPTAAWSAAGDALRALGLVDGSGRPTAAGRAAAGLGLHPRLGRLVLDGREQGRAGLACRLAALLEEADVLVGPPGAVPSDLELRLDALAGRSVALPPGVEIHRGRLAAVQRSARRLLGRLDGGRRSEGRGAAHERTPADRAGDAHDAMAGLVAAAFPERIAQRRERGDGRFLLRSGGGVRLDPHDPLASEPFLAVARAVGGGEPTVALAARLDPVVLRERFADEVTVVEEVVWDRRVGDVRAGWEERLGALVLRRGGVDGRPDADRTATALLTGIASVGLHLLPWTDALHAWRARVAFCRSVAGAPWPDLGDEALLGTLDTWLAPWLAGARRKADLAEVDLGGALAALLPAELARTLDRLAPATLVVPTGNRHRLDYGTGDRPVLAVKLQELFGCTATPTVADGRVAVLLHLLSPAGRPVAVTDDLVSFWANGYRQVRAELRGRYPRHPWPEDPLTAPPTARTNRRS